MGVLGFVQEKQYLRRGTHFRDKERKKENWFFYFRSLSSHKTFIFRHKIVSDEIKATDGKKRGVQRWLALLYRPGYTSITFFITLTQCTELQGASPMLHFRN